MKRAAWVTAVICVVAFIDLFLFGIYIPPLVWHVQHGNYVELQGVRYRLPLLYLARRPVRDQLLIATTSPRFRRKFAEIALGWHTSRMAEPEEEQFMRTLGLRKASSRGLTTASRQGTCLEYLPADQEANEKKSAPRTTSIVQCTFAGGLNAQLIGTQNTIPDFYAILESGEAVQGKH